MLGATPSAFVDSISPSKNSISMQNIPHVLRFLCFSHYARVDSGGSPIRPRVGSNGRNSPCSPVDRSHLFDTGVKARGPQKSSVRVADHPRTESALQKSGRGVSGTSPTGVRVPRGRRSGFHAGRSSDFCPAVHRILCTSVESLQIGHFAKGFGKVRRGSRYEGRPAPSAEQRLVHNSGYIFYITLQDYSRDTPVTSVGKHGARPLERVVGDA